jgi:hypothetical protein
MTKKHFKALAEEIYRIPDDNARRMAAEAVAYACRQFNPAFDRSKFFIACNVPA